MSSPLAKHWSFPPGLIFLNHGSFGATPSRVNLARSRWMERIEENPMRFFLRDLEGLADTARAFVAGLVNADADDLAWVKNASEGVSTVLRALRFEPGDEIVITSHGYNACNQAALHVAERSGARVVVAQVPFPITGGAEVTQAIAAVLSEKTKLVLVDHITSPTALVFPIADIVALCEARGIETLVDGAHAPGQTSVDLTALGASYYVANCHKWLCAPKSVSFLHVRRDKQAKIRPLVISHGANSPRSDRSRFRLEVDWTGTSDPTPMLCVQDSVSVLTKLAGSLAALCDRNRILALQMRDLLCAQLGVLPACPDAMTGSMVTLPLPPSRPGEVASIIQISPLQRTLAEDHQIEVPVFHFPAAPARWLRVSAQLYNDISDAKRLADTLLKLL